MEDLREIKIIDIQEELSYEHVVPIDMQSLIVGEGLTALETIEILKDENKILNEFLVLSLLNLKPHHFSSIVDNFGNVIICDMYNDFLIINDYCSFKLQGEKNI